LKVVVYFVLGNHWQLPIGQASILMLAWYTKCVSTHEHVNIPFTVICVPEGKFVHLAAVNASIYMPALTKIRYFPVFICAVFLWFVD
jgi:hypothetical protein